VQYYHTFHEAFETKAVICLRGVFTFLFLVFVKKQLSGQGSKCSKLHCQKIACGREGFMI